MVEFRQLNDKLIRQRLNFRFKITVFSLRDSYRIGDSLLRQVGILSQVFDTGLHSCQLEVKEYHDVDNQLYVAVTLNKETGVVDTAPPSGNTDVSSVSRPVLNLSISDLFSNINPLDGGFLKYVPDGFLDNEQIAVKRVVLAKEKSRIDALAKIGRKRSTNNASDKAAQQDEARSYEDFDSVKVFLSGRADKE